MACTNPSSPQRTTIHRLIINSPYEEPLPYLVLNAYYLLGFDEEGGLLLTV